MGLRHAVLGRGIAGQPLDWAERSLASNTTLKLPSYFFRAPLFERVSATGHDQHPCDHEQDRHASHLLILESRRCKASVVATAVSAAERLDRAWHQRPYNIQELLFFAKTA
jgi:hypothetical protein